MTDIWAGICRYMGGDKCAEAHCDFWDKNLKTCISALKDQKIAEVCDKMSGLLDEDPLILDKLKDAADLAEDMRKIMDKWS